MSVLADYQYTLEDFLNIKENSNINELDMLTIKIINKIASKVGAPNYIKTPVFKKIEQDIKRKMIGEILKISKKLFYIKMKQELK